MDPTAKPPTVLSLCTGYGGIEIGLSIAFGKLRVLAYVEIEAFACANLVAKMEAGALDPAPIWTDLKTLPMEPFRERIDIITGGYPCQPFSNAGSRKGEGDPRHLWPHIRKTVNVIRPQWCFFENVEGHISMGLSDVIEDLAGLGYRSTWGIFSAEEIGAPHRRKRVFILAHAYGVHRGPQAKRWFNESQARSGSQTVADSGGRRRSGIGGQGQKRASKCSQKLADTSDDYGRAGISGEKKGIRKKKCGRWGFAGGGQRQLWPARPGEPQFDWEEPREISRHDIEGKSLSDLERMVESESSLGRTSHGSSSRVDRLRLLGNGVVPMTAAVAWVTLMNELMEEPS